MNEVKPNKLGCFPVLPDGHHRVALGQGNAYNVFLSRQQQEGQKVLWVGVESVGFYGFGRNDFTHESYVAEKLKGVPPANFADFINDQVLPVENTAERQGRYEEVSCRDWNLSEMAEIHGITGRVEHAEEVFKQADKPTKESGGEAENVLTAIEFKAEMHVPTGTGELAKIALGEIDGVMKWLIAALWFDDAGEPPRLLNEVLPEPTHRPRRRKTTSVDRWRKCTPRGRSARKLAINSPETILRCRAESRLSSMRVLRWIQERESRRRAEPSIPVFVQPGGSVLSDVQAFRFSVRPEG